MKEMQRRDEIARKEVEKAKSKHLGAEKDYISRLDGQQLIFDHVKADLMVAAEKSRVLARNGAEHARLNLTRHCTNLLQNQKVKSESREQHLKQEVDAANNAFRQSEESCQRDVNALTIKLQQQEVAKKELVEQAQAAIDVSMQAFRV